MPDHESQRFVSYRSFSDEFEVEFIGGPLDGATIRTDICPDCPTFVHRVRERTYTYCYQRVSPRKFRAELLVGEYEFSRVPEGSLIKWKSLTLVALAVAVSMLLVAWRALLGLAT